MIILNESDYYQYVVHEIFIDVYSPKKFPDDNNDNDNNNDYNKVIDSDESDYIVKRKSILKDLKKKKLKVNIVLLSITITKWTFQFFIILISF